MTAVDRLSSLAGLPKPERAQVVAEVLGDESALAELRAMREADPACVDRICFALDGVLTTRQLALLRSAIRSRPNLRLVQPGESDDSPRRGIDPAIWQALQKTRGSDDAPPTIRASRWNFGTILRMDDRFAGRMRYNEFTATVELEEDGAWRPVEDVDATNVVRYMSDAYGIECNEATISAQMASAARTVKVHPVREYLDGLTWDGTQRLDWALGSLFGVDSQPDATRACSRAWLISMVARIYDPGCKVDTMPILTGSQGLGKSTTLRALMPVDSWFSDSEIELKSADRYQILRGRWLYEIGEFDKFSKHEASVIKAYLSSQVDTYRASYGRHPQQVPRQVVFAGTLNKREFLTDETGGRRFWVFHAGQCSPDYARQTRDQLWAEARDAYRAGEQWWLSREHAADMGAAAAAATTSDPWDSEIAAMLEHRQMTTADEVLESLIPEVGKRDNTHATRVRRALTRIGWEATNQRDGDRGKFGRRLWRRRTP